VLYKSLARFTDGRRIERHIPFAKGAPENPLSDEELHRKVVSQVEPVLGKARCSELMKLLIPPRNGNG
jgi:hypothetical protein